MNIGIDLLWVKPQVNGGGESYIRNLLDGLYNVESRDMKVYLFTANNNYQTFEKYLDNEAFKMIRCNTDSNSTVKRIIWENIHLNKVAVKNCVDVMFVPVYSKPLYRNNKLKYLITIHDLQAIHLPEYFSLFKKIWLKFAWKRSADTTDKIIAISHFDRNDIMSNLNIDSNKIEVIYNPIVLTNNELTEFEEIAKKYNIGKKDYFYTVSSMLPHKNLKTLLYVMKKIKDDDVTGLPRKLVISGVGGKSSGELSSLINKLGIQEEVIITGFVTNETRDSLYKNAKVFLFPSVFEGFGMPPVETMLYKTPVVACSIDVIKEVTQNRAIYVERYFDSEEWLEKIVSANQCASMELLNKNAYDLEEITNKYVKVFNSFKLRQ